MSILMDLHSDGIDILLGDSYEPLPTDTLLTKFEGWDGGSTMRRESIHRLNSHGEFNTPGKRAGQLIVINCDKEFSTYSEKREYLSKVKALLAEGGTGYIYVYDQDAGTEQMLDVKLETVIEPEVHGNNVLFGWELYAPDPIKYGGTRYIGSTLVGANRVATLSNDGTANLGVEFRVNGSFPEGFTIYEPVTGRSIVVTGSITASWGTPVSIDTATGKAFIGTTNISSSMTRREWTPVKPGSSVDFQLIANNATSVGFNVGVKTRWH